MSHKVSVKTELRDLKYIKKALDSLGFKYREAGAGEKLTTEGNYGVNEKVDILIESNSKGSLHRAVGFKKEADGTYTAVGDFYGLQSGDGRSLSGELMKQEVTAHAKEAEVNERLSNLMFSLDPSTRKETNTALEFTMARWVD